MICKRVILWGVYCLTCCSFQTAQAGKSFYEEFSDGSFTDGVPVRWARHVAPLDQGAVAIRNDSLVITPTNVGPTPFDVPNRWETDVHVVDQLYHDVDVLTRARATIDAPTAVGINVLDTSATDGLNGNSAFGYFVNDGGDRFLGIGYAIESQSTLSVFPLSLPLFTNDINLRLQVNDLTLKFTAWPEGQTEPAPQLMIQLPVGGFEDRMGHVGLWAASRSTPVPAEFRFFQVVPEPSVSLLFVVGGIALGWGRKLVPRTARI